MRKDSAGFSLIELMVAVSVFTLIMTASMGSVLSVLAANRKAQSLRAVMDNLDFALEGMTRTIRFGTAYHCGSGGDPSQPADCPSGDMSITVKSQNGQLVSYALSGSSIVRSVAGGQYYAVTSPDVTISKLSFRVFGSEPFSKGGQAQPEVIIVVSGFAGSQASSQSSFNLETTVSQLVFNSQ